MDERLRLLVSKISKMESEKAASWIIENYPVESKQFGEALLLLPHRSWRREDQKRLAMYYFSKLPFASDRGYQAFASFMSIRLLLECVEKNLPKIEERIDLLLYNLIPVLKRAAKNDNDRQQISDFEKKMRAI